MLRLKRYFTDIKKASVLYALCSVLFVCGFAANASPNMSHTVSVKTEAASASAARTAAHIQARRAAFENVLVRYAAWPEIERLSAETRDSDILNLVGTMSIADERQAATAYSATITITLDRAASARLLAEHNISNRLEIQDDRGLRTNVVFNASGGLRNWMDLVRDLNEAGAWSDLDVRISSIWGPRISATIRPGRRAAFVTSMRSAGWTVQEREGVLWASK